MTAASAVVIVIGSEHQILPGDGGSRRGGLASRALLLGRHHCHSNRRRCIYGVMREDIVHCLESDETRKVVFVINLSPT